MTSLILHDVANLLQLDRWRLEELRQTTLTRNAERHLTLLQVIAIAECLQGFAYEGFWIGVRLAENLWVFDIVERLGDDLLTFDSTTKSLESALAYFQSPD